MCWKASFYETKISQRPQSTRRVCKPLDTHLTQYQSPVSSLGRSCPRLLPPSLPVLDTLFCWWNTGVNSTAQTLGLNCLHTDLIFNTLGTYGVRGASVSSLENKENHRHVHRWWWRGREMVQVSAYPKPVTAETLVECMLLFLLKLVQEISYYTGFNLALVFLEAIDFIQSLSISCLPPPSNLQKQNGCKEGLISLEIKPSSFAFEWKSAFSI